MIRTLVLLGFVELAGSAIAATYLVYADRIAVKVVGSLASIIATIVICLCFLF